MVWSSFLELQQRLQKVDSEADFFSFFEKQSLNNLLILYQLF